MSFLFRRQPSAAGGKSSATVPAGRRIIGINSAPNLSVQMAALPKLGISRVRWTLYWRNYLDPREFAPDRTTPVGSGGETPAQFFDDDYHTLLNAGIEGLIVVHTPPDGMDLTAGLSAMPLFMAARAAQYPGARWQILNEMDGEDSFNGGWFEASNPAVTQLQRGASYGSLLAAVGAAIRAADPTATVIGGGIALAPADFITGLMSTCPRSAYDALAIHAYGTPDISQFVSKSQQARAVTAGVPLWCTEFGSLASDETAQRLELADVFSDYDAAFRYDRAYLYTLQGDASYQIMDAGGTFRQAASLFAGRTAL